MNLAELLEDRATQYGDSPLYTYLDKSLEKTEIISYAGLYESARKIAGKLQDMGAKDKPVILLYPHGPEFISAFFGCILASAIPMPQSVPRGRNWALIDNVIRTYGVELLLTDDSRISNLHLAEACKQRVRVTSSQSIDSSYADILEQNSRKESDIAFVQFSSGSTSKPKGVAISHENILHNSMIIKDAFGIGKEDVGINWLPFYHDMGLIGHVIQPLYSGIQNYFMSPISFVARPGNWLKAISMYRGTISLSKYLPRLLQHTQERIPVCTLSFRRA
jgi:acyl-CoA synthetase (AMP-forming)/AMP-acid ligase II